MKKRINKKIETNIKISMIRKRWWSQDNILRNIRCYEISELQPGQANSRSLESDLVRGKIKEIVIYTIIVFTTMITYTI